MSADISDTNLLSPYHPDQDPGENTTRQDRELLLKILLVLGCCLWIELALFKYLPDLGTAVYQHGISSLTDFATFEDSYISGNSVHSARFLGNHILLNLAKLLEAYVHSADIRCHPLRIAAALLTPAYFIIGVLPIFFATGKILNWRVFLAGYAALFASGMYIFYPCDAPSLAVFSLGLFLLLQDRLPGVLLCLVVMTLFRESAFHFVAVTVMWALVCRQGTVMGRVLWVMAMALVFALEYKIIRIYFPGPLTGSGGLILTSEIFTGAGLLSLTSLATLPLALLFPLLYLCLRAPGRENIVFDRFFLLNCLAFPFWLLFYRMFGGNITEFRMLWPALLPLVYGMAMLAGRRENQTI
jgi:hypothetical protein